MTLQNAHNLMHLPKRKTESDSPLLSDYAKTIACVIAISVILA